MVNFGHLLQLCITIVRLKSNNRSVSTILDTTGLFNYSGLSIQNQNQPLKVKKIRSLVKKAKDPASPEEVAKIKAKWMKCRNPALTDEKLLVFVDDEDDTISG